MGCCGIAGMHYLIYVMIAMMEFSSIFYSKRVHERGKKSGVREIESVARIVRTRRWDCPMFRVSDGVVKVSRVSHQFVISRITQQT